MVVPTATSSRQCIPRGRKVGFNGNSQFSTWLNRIAINVALMLLRKRRSHPEVFIDRRKDA
jgi:DNA-directed RNA polymerase specialized sigma24 family protein